ncbi:MAG: mechanosensitive ion channel [Methanomassiliicoccales archaeon]
MYEDISAATDANDWLTSYGWSLLLLFLIFVVFLYLWSYFNKNLEKMKTTDNKYLDPDLIKYLGKLAKIAMITIILLMLGLVLSEMWESFNRSVWQPYIGLISQLVIVLMAVLFAGLVAKMFRNISRNYRLRSVGKGMQGSAAEIVSLLASYIVYILAAVFVVIVLLAQISDINIIEHLSRFWEESGGKIEVLAIFLIALFLTIRLINTIFEDFKFRTKKFDPQVVELLNSLVRYVFYLIGFMVTVFILFSVMGLEQVGIILIVTILVFISLSISLSYPTIKNIVAGLAIMNTEIFTVGDKVRIGTDLICEIIEKNLVFTKVRTEDGETVSVPNSEIISSRVLNYKRSLAHGISVIFDVPIMILYEDVEAMVKRAVNAVDGLMKEPAPILHAVDIHDGKIRYELNAYVLDALRAKKVRSDLIKSIQLAQAADEKVKI